MNVPFSYQQNETKIKEVEAAYRAHKIKLGAAQDAIAQRDEVFKELATIARRFRAICRTALKDHPQLLEKLGIKVYSPGYVKAKPKKDEEQPPADGGSTQAAAAGISKEKKRKKRKKLTKDFTILIKRGAEMEESLSIVRKGVPSLTVFKVISYGPVLQIETPRSGAAGRA